MRKYGKRRDKIHREVRDVFTAYGWSWIDLADLGHDVPDALAHKAGTWLLLEVKTGNAKLKPGQQRFSDQWPVTIIRSVQEAELAARHG